MSTFAKAFRALVYPNLKRLAEDAAWLLSRDRIDFHEAHAWVLREAAARGANHLPDPDYWSLTDWIDTQILVFESDFLTNPAVGAAYVKDRVP